MVDRNYSVLFLELNSSYSHSMLSYCLLRALSEEQAPEWQWFHVDATLKTPADDIIDSVAAFSPKVIFATAYIFNIEYLCILTKRIKSQLGNCYIFLGGPSFIGDNQNFLLANPYLNGVIRGDESSIPELLNAIKKHDSVKKVSGLCQIEQGRYNDNGKAEFHGDLDELPSPYVAPFLHQGKPFYQLETSRGCLGSCTFCTSSVQKSVKTFSLQRIKDDLAALAEKGFSEIRLIDRTFNEDPKRAVAMLELFKEDFPQMKFHLEVHPGRLQPEVAELLASMPAEQLHIEAGIQSFDPIVLINIKRATSPGVPEKRLSQLVKMGNFEVHADLISGLPEQTLKSLENDILKMLQISPDEIQLEPLKILPGTPIRDQLDKWGIEFMEKPPWQVIKTKAMSEQDIERSCLYSHVLDSYYNTAALRNTFSFCVKQNPKFFIEFSYYFAEFKSSKGKLSLEKRFEILENFLSGNSSYNSLQICRFAKLAAGFKVSEIELTKTSGRRGKTVWKNDSSSPVVRCSELKCDFNVADFWLNRKYQVVKTGKFTYYFMMHYGRNVCEIILNTN
ncbi:MAG: DUF4080 domain-containing protein [Lentisphaerae bacterium]|nr:DUF4080 domain-containing protein [Lentisphaerota bacterium]MCP4101867.1 DUF4080 domain-containing protein [Lentisphaerota bacterium]